MIEVTVLKQVVVRSCVPALLFVLGSVLSLPAQNSGPQATAYSEAYPDGGLYLAALAEPEPAKRLELLQAWKARHPESQLELGRTVLLLSAYQQLNDAAKATEAVQEFLRIAARDLGSGVWIGFPLPAIGSERDAKPVAAPGLPSHIDSAFDPERKPAGTSESDWTKTRAILRALALRTQGWQAKRPEDREALLMAALRMNPADGLASLLLGRAIYAQRQVEGYPVALFHLARAVAYEGAGALNPAVKAEFDAFLTKAYTAYHGNDNGLADVKALAASSAFP